MKYIGIDIGLTGGIGVIETGAMGVTRVLMVCRMPTVKVKVARSVRNQYDTAALKQILLEHAVGAEGVCVVMERLWGRPGQNANGTFSLGKGSGLMEGMVVMAGIPYELVTPQVWKKALIGGTSQDKGASIVKCHQVFPGIAIGKSDGMAEALLLAEYGRRTLGGAGGETTQ